MGFDKMIEKMQFGLEKTGRLRLEVQKNNEKAKSLYTRLGFLVESEQDDDYIMIKIY